MQTKLSVVVQDPLIGAKYGLVTENVMTSKEDFSLDGPVAERVAIIDRDPSTGQMQPRVKWEPESETYVPADFSSPAGIAVSVFGLVLETLEMFERQDVLAQRIKWAFNSPQLLVVPNAGIWQNAFYDRYSRSLQFFSFDSPEGKTVYTGLSRDIVAHETGHAVLDGLAPALYDALTPQSLALHEAIGDLTAIVMALQSRRIQEWLLKKFGGRLSDDTPIPTIGDEFGYALGLKRPLRNANNSFKIGAEVGEEPHNLCQVLTGACWKAIVKMNNSCLDKANLLPDSPDLAKNLGVFVRQVSRILFRPLDFIPPAEATFADYCRSVLRSDEVGFLQDDLGYREILREEFVSRGIVGNGSELDCQPEEEWVHVNLDNIIESEWAAYAFAEKMRKLLKIPTGVPFRLFPRRDIMRAYHVGPGKPDMRREVVFQLTWEKPEENREIPGLPRRRGVFHGTTLVIGGESDGKGRYPLLSCLTTDRSEPQEQARNRTVLRLVERGQLEIGNRQVSFSSRPLVPRVFGRVTDDILRLRGTARLIQLTEFEDER
jgi:hypothetical protein